VVALAAGAQRSSRGTDELVFESESMSFDLQNNLIQARRPRIRQGNLHIVADEAVATGIEVDKASEWRLTGGVRIEVGTAVLEAASAVFTAANEQLSRGELVGAPVSFSDVDATQKTRITGRAQRMSYDYVAQTLRMYDASVQKGNTEILGCDLIYDFKAERVTSGSADCTDPFRARRIPGSEARPAPAAPQ
ncbi:MAG TPA: LptA/OstA family protein, partial [Gammaproteobacteria bacterium]|nr:LptA/OstA family protein [Gammaproteobacteria bacterium]